MKFLYSPLNVAGRAHTILKYLFKVEQIIKTDVKLLCFSKRAPKYL